MKLERTTSNNDTVYNNWMSIPGTGDTFTVFTMPSWYKPIKLEFTLCRCLTEAREIGITWRNKDSCEQSKKKKKKRILVPISKDFYFHYYWQLCYYAPKVPLTKSLYEESKKNSSCPDKHTDWENEVTEQVKATVQVKLQFQGLIYYPNIILSFRPDGKILRDSFLSESFSSLCLPKLLTFSFS